MASTSQSVSGVACLAFPEREAELCEELAARFGISAPVFSASSPAAFCENAAAWYGSLLYLPGVSLPAAPYWARTMLTQPQILRFDSALDAAKAMRMIQRNWGSYQYRAWSRAELVVKKLPFLRTKPRVFPFDVPTLPMGLFTLIDDHTALMSAETTDAAPLGDLLLAEDHESPPSRAYLKLQEALLRHRAFFGSQLPHEGARCFDAGACPGGWTWVLRQLGSQVFAVDRAPLAPALMADPQVTFQAHDAFTLTPDELGSFDWVVSDVICYPTRLLEWVKLWRTSGRTHNMICTIKLQGGTDWETVAAFAAIPRSKVLHLNANKHELTWLWCGEETR